LCCVIDNSFFTLYFCIILFCKIKEKIKPIGDDDDNNVEYGSNGRGMIFFSQNRKSNQSLRSTTVPRAATLITKIPRAKTPRAKTSRALETPIAQEIYLPHSKNRFINCFCFRKNLIEPHSDITELKPIDKNPSNTIDDQMAPNNEIRKFWLGSCFENKVPNPGIIYNNKFDEFDYYNNPFVIQISNVSDNEGEKFKIYEKCISFGEITGHCFDSGYLYVS
jgi:hypothetical protein